MGALLEINDTLQITTEQGFPADVLDFEKHCKEPVRVASLSERVFRFAGKAGLRFYQHDPVRVYLVHNIRGKWLFWGRILIYSQTITGSSNADYETSGEYKITDIYDPAYQESFTRRESPAGLSYFPTV